jgi:long-subunit acyl-CoA synthetase (AMP-forming)
MFLYILKNKVTFLLNLYGCLKAKKIPILSKYDQEINQQLKEHFKKSNKILFIIFTSGSEGKPKGVLMSKSAFLFSCKSMNKVMKMNKNQIEAIYAPLDHAFALGRCHSIIMKKGTLFLADEKNPVEFMNFLRTNQNLGLSMVPSILATLIKIDKKFLNVLKKVKYIQTGAMKFPNYVREKILKIRNLNMYLHYGLSEMMRTTFLNLSKYPNHIDSEGRPFVGNKIKILNNELLVKGKGLCLGYLNQKLWKEKIYKGWYKTGDLGQIKDGFFYFKGRKSSLINYNGNILNPEFYEEKLKKKFKNDFCLIPSKDRIKDDILNLVSNNQHLTLKEINLFFYKDNKGIQIENFYYIKTFPKTRTEKISRKKIRLKKLKKVLI